MTEATDDNAAEAVAPDETAERRGPDAGTALASRTVGGRAIETAIRSAHGQGRVALAGYLTGGFPDLPRFQALLPDVGAAVDVLEVGVPFSDPMADGVTIQRASERALQAGTTLAGLLDILERTAVPAPIVLMSYFNPVLQMGLDTFAERAARATVAGLIVPDVPLEESAVLREALEPAGVACIQLVTPVTPTERLHRLCAASDGFVYAVTMTGTTGAALARRNDDVAGYLARVRGATTLPVLAGFGIRTPDDVRALRAAADGVVVGSAVVEAVDAGEDPTVLLRALREGGA